MQLRPHQQRALDAIKNNNKGCVYVPTGGGKTVIMMEDCKRRFLESDDVQTIVVVAPRILLANQLFEEFFEHLNGHVSCAVMHVHSGEVDGFRTTKPEQIAAHDAAAVAAFHQLIFTTYHSLGRIVDSGINVDVMYCDEAHNATQKSHFVGVAATSMAAESAYFFTATPKYSRNPHARGMNNKIVFGDTLESVPAPELINNGSIIPPRAVVHESELVRTKDNAHEVDRDLLISVVDDLSEEQSAKVLVAAPNTRVLWNMLSKTDVLSGSMPKVMTFCTSHLSMVHTSTVRKLVVKSSSRL